MTENDFKRIENMLARHTGAVEQNAQHKFDLLVEGQQALAERMDRMDVGMQKLDERMTRVEVRLTRVEPKVDGVAADLAAHRAIPRSTGQDTGCGRNSRKCGGARKLQGRPIGRPCLL